MFEILVYKLIYFLMRKENKIMALFLAHRIINGYLHFWQIPKGNIWREEVKQILIQEGKPELVIEDKPKD